MKKFIVLAFVVLCSLATRAENWEAVHMFVVPEALWAEWSDSWRIGHFAG